MEVDQVSADGPDGSDSGPLNGGPDLDHSVTMKQSKVATPDAGPSSRPRRKSARKTISPAKVSRKTVICIMPFTDLFTFTLLA